MQILHTNCWERNQSLCGATYALKGGRRYKAGIRRNAHDDQSSAKVSIWDGDKWNLVVTAPIADLAIYKYSYVAQPGTWETTMKASLLAMLDLAFTILEG